MILENIKITTQMLLQGAFFFALVDVFYLPLLSLGIKPPFFKQIKWNLVLVSGLVWVAIWISVLSYFWDSVYHYVFPLWSRPWIPFAFGSLMAGVSFFFWTYAKEKTHFPVITFCLFGGFWGICTHTWAIFRGIMTRPPMLQGASPLAALLLAFFEFTFYWCVITTIAALPGWVLSHFKKK